MHFKFRQLFTTLAITCYVTGGGNLPITVFLQLNRECKKDCVAPNIMHN